MKKHIFNPLNHEQYEKKSIAQALPDDGSLAIATLLYSR